VRFSIFESAFKLCTELHVGNIKDNVGQSSWAHNFEKSDSRLAGLDRSLEACTVSVQVFYNIVVKVVDGEVEE
jgi:hypothetical protein